METDSIVTPENTKLIAEWMDIKLSSVDGMLFVSTYTTYNLITNSDQSREVEKKLLGLGAVIDKVNGTYWLRIKSKGIHETAETLNLTIFKAALYEAKK